VKENYKHY